MKVNVICNNEKCNWNNNNSQCTKQDIVISKLGVSHCLSDTTIAKTKVGTLLEQEETE